MEPTTGHQTTRSAGQRRRARFPHSDILQLVNKPQQIRDLLEEKLGDWSSRKRRSQRELWSGPEWRQFHENRRGRAFVFRRQPSQLIAVAAHTAAIIGLLIPAGALSSGRLRWARC